MPTTFDFDTEHFLMTQFILVLHNPPWSHQSVVTACDFARAAHSRGDEIKAIFLYQDAVLNGLSNLDIPSDELDGQQQLITLQQECAIPLLMCVTAAEKRGLDASKIRDEFTLSGLAEFAELTVNADKVIQFK